MAAAYIVMVLLLAGYAATLVARQRLIADLRDATGARGARR